jgi:hypothetical protein
MIYSLEDSELLIIVASAISNWSYFKNLVLSIFLFPPILIGKEDNQYLYNHAYKNFNRRILWKGKVAGRVLTATLGRRL